MCQSLQQGSSVDAWQWSIRRGVLLGNLGWLVEYWEVVELARRADSRPVCNWTWQAMGVLSVLSGVLEATRGQAGLRKG